VIKVHPGGIHPLSVGDLDDVPDDGWRYEIIDGSLHVSPPASNQHQQVSHRVQYRLQDVVPPDLMTWNASGIRLADDRWLVPDVMVLRTPATQSPGIGVAAEDVVLVVEVVSPSNAAHDLVTKRALYAEHGIAHYWIVDIRDVRQPVLRVLRLEAGQYVEEAFAGDERASLTQPVPIELSATELLA
jgi:Uma2 family endonuclease